MGDAVPIRSEPDTNSSGPLDARAQSIATTIKVLFNELPLPDQERVFAQLAEILRPIPAPRAGDVLGAVVYLLPKRSEWRVQELKKQIDDYGIEASAKEIYNALGYLTRKGKIKRIGHGLYSVDGAVMATMDDLGVGPPTRHEIDDT
jgi:hypothetical protein